MNHRVAGKMQFLAHDYQPEFLLARLQKAQRSVMLASTTVTGSEFEQSAEPALRDFAQQEIAEHADALRGPQLFGVDKIGFDRRAR
jgi:hypothetical protein